MGPAHVLFISVLELLGTVAYVNMVGSFLRVVLLGVANAQRGREAG